MNLVLRLFIDTGPFIARHNRRDRDHINALESFEKIRKNETPYRKLYTSDYILDEAVTGCRRRTDSHRLSVELGTAFLASESLVLLSVERGVLEEAWELYKTRLEVDLSLTDCTTAVLAKRHGIVDIFTYDADFQALGFHSLAKL